MKGFIRFAFLCVLLAFGASAWAEELLINSNATITATDPTHDGKQLIVDGATLTLSGEHQFASVLIRNSGVITSPADQSFKISADTIEVDVSSRLDVSGKGLLGTAAIGNYNGGSYGGNGGLYNGTGVTNTPYGDFRVPKDLGTGGGATDNNFTRGGGAVELQAKLLKLDGKILANGETKDGDDEDYGSGSGGSVLLRVETLEVGGAAQIQANGGGSANCCNYGGGGGGGRIGVYTRVVDTTLLPLVTRARGGVGYYGSGSAGTIYLSSLDTNEAELIVDNSSVDMTLAATTRLDLGETGELAGKLTIVNAKVELVGGKLGVVSLKDSVLTQAGDAQVSNLQLSGGIWDQAGFSLQADSHSFGAGSTLRVGSAFSGLGVADLLVDGFTLELSSSGSWSSVRVLNGGVIGMVAASSSQTQGITIRADSIEVDATSRIDVSGKGLLGTTAIGNYSGGSYGGRGGSSTGSANASYGDFRAPKDLGTGGRGKDNNFTRGGGAVELQAKLLKLNGKILADGQTNTSSYGSGSGGSVLLRVDALELGGAAQIQANGGGSASCCTYGSGGGGRIAVYYRTADAATLPKVTRAKGGISYYSTPFYYGSAGTIYLNDLDTNDGELIVDNSGVDKARAATTRLDLGETGELDEKLTIVNAKVELVGGKLEVVSLKDSVLTQTGDVQVGSLQVSGSIWDQAGFALQADSHSFGAGSTLRVGSAFNGLGVTDLLVDGFTLELSNSGSWSSVRVLNGGVIGMVAASGSQTQGITVRADSIEVDATSRIDVSGKGLLGTTAIGDYSGGSYGGSGGLYNSAASTNAPYGDFRAPKDLGTGGRATGNNFTRGGGAMELQAKLLKLNGKILANGQTNTNEYGSGSGGSVLLRVDTLELGGAAQIQANGGSSTAYRARGGGGGGRIAVYYRTADAATLPKVTQARGGLSYFSTPFYYGSAGTIYLNDLDTNDGELIVDNSGVDKARAATTRLDLGETGELDEKLTIVNAKVELVGGKLEVVSLKDSVLTQTGDVQVGSLQVSGSIWDQAGFALQADSHSFGAGATLRVGSAFNGLGVTDLLVDGFTLELSNSGSWSSVRVLNGGVIGMVAASANQTQGITISADSIEVDATSRIDVSGKGLLGTTAIGNYSGGSYGGSGGSSAASTNAPYGDFRAPKDLGTGGRATGNNFTRGGGAVELQAKLLKLDGKILADGYPNTSSYGSGSGGSVLLRVDALELGGAAQIQANGGGSANCCTYGGGGGGALLFIIVSWTERHYVRQCRREVVWPIPAHMARRAPST